MERGPEPGRDNIEESGPNSRPKSMSGHSLLGTVLGILA